jgi:hypothetical protein
MIQLEQALHSSDPADSVNVQIYLSVSVVELVLIIQNSTDYRYI